ncbi:MAG: hypothetical protein ACJ8F7_21365 [Gemmataceae bacterium]
MLRITCPACRSALRIEQPVPAGTRIECPKCNTMFLPSPEELTAPVVLAAADDEPPAGRRSKKSANSGSPAATAVTVVALLLLIVGGVGAGAAFWWESHKKEQLAKATHAGLAPELRPGNRPTIPPGTAPPRPAEPAEVQVGHAAMEIEAEDIDGKKFKLSDYRGKVVLLDFWGNW